MSQIPNAESQNQTPTPRSDRELNLPRILAPAGDRQAFFAALNTGADAIYLGLQEFNARSRATNFELKDLEELVPLAHALGVEVLVTLNILLKQSELSRLIALLTSLRWIGVDALIVQDLGVARLIREHFPSFRLHASTQMAIHNLSGVQAAQKLGFKRVVLARELTSQEWRLIQRHVRDQDIELEVFCHGSLCYSYSGLCFFSGAEDARSGNRGECAYTCRVPYKILSEPGHGFLFSMKDLDTSQDLERFVQHGIHTLKIEGRKKDAQYVASVVRLYRQELDAVAQRHGIVARPSRQPLDHDRDPRQDLAFSFQRETCSFFVRGRYHENVIDLNHPSHQGVYVGKVEKLEAGWMEVQTQVDLARYDGLRLVDEQEVFHASPQPQTPPHPKQKADHHWQKSQDRYKNQDLEFSLRQLQVDRKNCHGAQAGCRVRIALPDPRQARPRVRVGQRLYKTRSNDLKSHVASLTQGVPGQRLRPWRRLNLHIHGIREAGLPPASNQAKIKLLITASIPGESRKFFEFTTTLAAEAPRSKDRSQIASELQSLFSTFGNHNLQAALKLSGDLQWFVPRSQLKSLKRDFGEALHQAMGRDDRLTIETVERRIQPTKRQSVTGSPEAQFLVKCDRLDYLPELVKLRTELAWDSFTEIVFEPKRAFLPQANPQKTIADILDLLQGTGLHLRLAIPTVMRAWDEPYIAKFTDACIALGQKRFEVGNLGAWHWLQSRYGDRQELNLHSDFSLYALNLQAIQQLFDLGMERVSLSIEDDRTSLQDKLTSSMAARTTAILYKDTPLFIAEACSLTALHNGCPSAKVCGYRDLHIANEAGEEFVVSHEACKSIVYGKRAYSINEYQALLQEWGVESFRLDFLTRNYRAEELRQIILDCLAARPIAESHPANFNRVLK